MKANGEKEGGGSSKRKGRKRKTGERKEKWRESKGEGGKEGEPEKKEKGIRELFCEFILTRVPILETQRTFSLAGMLNKRNQIVAESSLDWD